MKRGIVLGVLMAVGALSMTVAGFQGQGRGRGQQMEGLLQQPQGPWREGRFARIEKLRDNVYRILNTGSNCTVFITEPGVVMIESGYPGWGREILDKLKSINLPPKGPRRSPQNQARANMVATELGKLKTGK